MQGCYRIKALTLRVVLGEAILEDSVDEKLYNGILQQTVMKCCELGYILCELNVVSYAETLLIRGRQILTRLSTENSSQVKIIDTSLQVTTALVESRKGNVR